MTVLPGELEEAVAAVRLVDHHVHGAFAAPVDRARFEEAINEASPDPVPAWMSQFDSQLGLAIRAHCAPVLDLEPHAPADRYWARRAELGEAEVTRRFVRAAGVDDWIVDTGYGTGGILTPDQLADLSDARGHEIVRIEAVGESVGRSGVGAASYADALADQLDRAARAAVGFKTIVAYRTGFDIDWSAPTSAQVDEAASRWIDAGAPRLTDPVLIRHGVHTALRTGLPLQIHVGFGDRDLDLHRCNPMLLLELLRGPAAGAPVMLLHCYPYHREAGYLAQAFDHVYCDVGLALNYVGARATAVLAESLELPPFAKVLYSSDAWGPAELHYLGSFLWRRAVRTVLGGWVTSGDWSEPDAVRIARMMATGNARRVYQLD
jgi:predicted TIM-barrel fold metal-dependent hydrolase